jgi:hypothetical protein
MRIVYDSVSNSITKHFLCKDPKHALDILKNGKNLLGLLNNEKQKRKCEERKEA